MIYIGVDPGASGGMANLFDDHVFLSPMPATEKDVWEWFASFSDRNGGGKYNSFAVIEKVGGYLQGGGDGPGGGAANGSAMFKFGKSVGFLIGCLTAAGIPFEEVTPQKWQKGLGIPPRKKGESKTDWKNRLKQFAQRLYPSEKITLATADALLLATYAQRKQEGTL